MAKLKKISVWTFGLIIGIAVILQSLIQQIISYGLSKVPSILTYLQSIQSVWLLILVNLVFTFIVAGIAAVVLAMLYNLLSKYISLSLGFEDKKKK